MEVHIIICIYNCLYTFVVHFHGIVKFQDKLFPLLS